MSQQLVIVLKANSINTF